MSVLAKKRKKFKVEGNWRRGKGKREDAWRGVEKVEISQRARVIFDNWDWLVRGWRKYCLWWKVKFNDI